MRILIVLALVALADGQSCPTGWHEHDNHCYYVTASGEQSAYTWHEAQEYCMRQGANLASVHSNEERDFIIAQANANGYTGLLWIGYNRLNNRDENFVWADASNTTYEDWGPSQPSSGGLEMCAYTVLSHSEADAQSNFERHDGHSVIKGLISSPSEADGVDTFDFGDVFDFSYDECERRCGEESRCMAYTQFPSWYPDSFNTRCVGRSNKDEMFEPESDVLSGVRIVTTPGYWYSSNCGYEMGFVCKTSVVSEGVTPLTTVPTTDTHGYCPDEYFAIGNKCFLVVMGTPQDGKTWDEALEHCRTQPGLRPDLASIQNVMENNALTAQLQESSYGYWIGLHRGTTETDQWVWTDNGPTSYSKWHPGSPENNKGNCAEFWNSRYPGTWNDHHCTDKRGYICETFKDGTVDNAPATTPNSCPSNYKPYWYGCYKFEVTRLSRDAAEARCRADGAELVSVYSEAENAAVNYYADTEETSGEYYTWIGLQKGDDSQYRWSDGWVVYYTNWATGEPKVDGGCVAMGRVGTWHDFKCLDNFPSMCKKTDTQPFTTPTPRPGVCPGTEWIDYGGHCYYFADTPSSGSEDNPLQSWDNAQARCEALAGKTHRGHLVSIHSEAENKFVFGEMQSRLAQNPNIWMAWIGLHKTSDDPLIGFEWVDRSPVEYVSWVPGEPDSTGPSACVHMHIQMWQGHWDDDDCSLEKYYICKAEKAPVTEAPSTPAPVSGSCPKSDGVGEWESLGDQCFVYYTDVALRHHNSTEQCRELDASLPSVHSDAENWLLREAFREAVLPWGWIGLYRIPGDDLSTWHWADGTLVEYTNWEEGEPNDNGGGEHCVEMDSSNGQWNDVECQIERPFACKAPKSVSSGSLSGGAIFGVVVGVLAGIVLLSVLAGVVLTYLRNHDIFPGGGGGGASPGAPASVHNPSYDASRHEEFVKTAPDDTPTYDNV